MKPPYFFKVYCRLGLPNFPIHSKEFNVGVENAPDEILTQDFLFKFPGSEVSEFIFPKPEDIDPKNYWEVLVKNLVDFKNVINRSLINSQIQIVVGGDNSVTFSSFLAVLERFGVDKVGYIQFDSHGEANSYAGSISKNFHGMYMRPFLDKFDNEEIDNLVPNKIPAENFLSIGNLDLDPDEDKFYRSLDLKNFNKGNIAGAADFLKAFIQKFEHIHINFDVDVFDKSIVSATGIPTENGLFPEQIFPLLAIIRSHPDWSLDLVEVNPKKGGALETIQMVQKILRFMLK